MTTKETTSNELLGLLPQFVVCSLSLILIWSMVLSLPKKDGPKPQSRVSLNTYLLSRSIRN